MGLGLFNDNIHFAQLSLPAEKLAFKLWTLSYVVKLEMPITDLSVTEKAQVMAHFEGLPRAYPFMGESFN